MPQKKAYHHGNLREALLEAAIEIIDHDGVGALTIRKLADKVGVSHAAPAYHFHDKNALLIAVATEGFRRLGEYFVRCLDEADPTERVKKLGYAYVSFALEHPAHYRVMFGPELSTIKSDDPEFTNVASGAFSFLHDTMKEIYPDDSTDEGEMDSLTAALSAWSTTHGLVMLWIDGTLKCRFEEWTDGTYQQIANHVIANLYPIYQPPSRNPRIASTTKE